MKTISILSYVGCLGRYWRLLDWYKKNLVNPWEIVNMELSSGKEGSPFKIKLFGQSKCPKTYSSKWKVVLWSAYITLIWTVQWTTFWQLIWTVQINNCLIDFPRMCHCFLGLQNILVTKCLVEIWCIPIWSISVWLVIMAKTKAACQLDWTETARNHCNQLNCTATYCTFYTALQ